MGGNTVCKLSDQAVIDSHRTSGYSICACTELCDVDHKTRLIDPLTEVEREEIGRDEIRQSYNEFDAVEQQSKETGVNPKDLIGVQKLPLAIVPWTAVGGMCLALLDGASKYGPFNWRDIPVQSHIYIEAALGHLMSYADGEDNAQDSGLHHLYHAMACCAIILDAIQADRLGDTRYTVGKPGIGSFTRDPTKYQGDPEKIKELLKRPWRQTSIGSDNGIQTSNPKK